MPVRLNGSSSGFVELAAPAAAGSTTLELPTDSIKPGLVLLAQESFSAVSTVSVDSVFSAEYDNYRLVASITGSTSLLMLARLRASGTDDTGTNYSRNELVGATTPSATRSTGQTSFYFIAGETYGPTTQVADIYNPAKAAYTRVTSQMAWSSSATNPTLIMHMNQHALASAYDGMTFFTSTGTATGSLSIFAYRSTL